MNLAEFIQQTVLRISSASETPLLDAQVLSAFLLKKNRSWVLAHPEYTLDAGQLIALQAAVARLASGEPLPYVLGRWEFYGLQFDLTPAVLIPRPETELLVGYALSWLGTQSGPCLAADVGTGSGCIAVSMAVNSPSLSLEASDISFEALQVAQRNARKHQVADRIAFIQSDLLPPGVSRYNLICANLPYIPNQELKGLKVSRREPRLALDGGEAGRDLISRLLAQAPVRLAPGGLLLLEIEASQGAWIRTEARGAFPASDIESLYDLAGNERLVAIRLS